MLKRRTVILLCGVFSVVGFVSGLSFLGFASILVPSTHATGYSQSIHTDLSPLLTPTPCLTPTPSPTPLPPTTPTVGTTPVITPAPTPTIGTTPVTTPAPPELRVEPTSLSFSVPPGTSSTQLIRITNIG